MPFPRACPLGVLVPDNPELRGHYVFFLNTLALVWLSSPAELAGQSHFQSSFIFSRANAMFPLNGDENMGEERIESVANIVVCWP